MAAPARAELRIDIVSGTVEPMPIAITDFHGDRDSDNRVGRQLAEVISAEGLGAGHGAVLILLGLSVQAYSRSLSSSVIGGLLPVSKLMSG